MNSLMGSSPLARGTQTLEARWRDPAGLIPARAGNTPRTSVEIWGVWAHPRSRGEHFHAALCGQPEVGSSPLARGTQTRLSDTPKCLGLIPARAGNTRKILPPWPQTWAHPRSRGEHTERQTPMDSEQGSSPLARGTLVLIMLLLMVFGLIPARAGNTPRLRCVIRFSRAHPRSRGEHWFTVSSLTCYLGSSPLARGTLSRHRAQLLKLGLIPARAGNTRHRDHSTPCPRAHPRSRGEHYCH